MYPFDVISAWSHRQPAVALGLALLIVKIIRSISRMYTLGDLPGPRPQSWLFGHEMEIQTSPAGKLHNQWAETYGPTYKLKGPLGTSYLITGDPKAASHVLHSDNYVRPGDDTISLEQFFGKGLFSAEGKRLWPSGMQMARDSSCVRAIVNPAFTPATVREVSHVIFDLARNLTGSFVDELEREENKSGKIFELTSRIPRLTLDAISMTTFAYDVGNSDQSIPNLIAKISDVPETTGTLIAMSLITLFPSLLYLPNPMKQWTTMLRTELGKIADIVWTQNVEERGLGMHSKLLDSMNDSYKRTGEPLDREQAIATIIGVIFAGYETTANVIIETLYELSRSPNMQTQLRNEIEAFCERTGREPTCDDLVNATQLPFLDAVVRESLRTKAVLTTIAREAVKEDVLALQFPIPGTSRTQIAVKPGQIVLVPVRDGINVDARIWGPDAAIFRPERWLEPGGLPETVKDIHAPGHFLTFGDGAKTCLGRHFAVAEIKVNLSNSIHFALHLTDTQIVLTALIRDLIFEPDDQQYMFYRTGGNTIKPKIIGREHEGPQLYLHIRKVHDY
ncbi:uncharacterized protein FIBRA_07112 [Fibroporia radiculosa]|uniref:Cytochrome P450 n=1 Tax=Fibroporia radiculosa TaxID=599839 RepID=J4GUD2_9APHY|nr:uncharacterized protein FIBRA_07112 [Fibroporia radiculosa]CCM04915.1 predicted protein [Fibroporia radiculosa]